MGMFSEDYFNDETLAYLIEHGYLKIHFENDQSCINEADNFIIKNGDSYLDIYVRSKIEGRGSNVMHGPSVKVCRCDQNGKKIGDFYPYKIPSGKKINDEPEIVGNTREHKKFDKNNGKIVKSFIKSYQTELLEYWETDNSSGAQKERDKIKNDIDKRLKKE